MNGVAKKKKKRSWERWRVNRVILKICMEVQGALEGTFEEVDGFQTRESIEGQEKVVQWQNNEVS